MKQSPQFSNLVYLIMVLTAVIATAILGVFALNFSDQEFSPRVEDWGHFGSYLGTLAAWLSMATFILLLLNIQISQRQFLASRHHDEILLLHEMLKSVNAEIEEVLGLSDDVGEIDKRSLRPTGFPLVLLKDKRTATDVTQISDIDHLDPFSRASVHPQQQLAPAQEIFLGWPPEYLDSSGGPSPTWYDMLVLTNSPFVQLLKKLVQLNDLLDQVKNLSESSPILRDYQSRHSSTALVLIWRRYLKYSEVRRVLTEEDDQLLKDNWINWFVETGTWEEVVAEREAEIEQWRQGDDSSLYANAADQG